MADANTSSTSGRAPAAGRPRSNIKETLTAITISLVMAFVFRGFVVEGFQIPTGSMAPTLLGDHILVQDPESGYEWPVGPWDYPNDRAQPPAYPLQGGVNTPRGTTPPVTVNVPVTGERVQETQVPLRAGDRLFVLKYVGGLYEPDRWDVPVFKVPTIGTENYIKRLTGLPEEQVAIVDGDIFSRPREAVRTEAGWAAWAEEGWRVERKPERVQRAMWRTLFDSRYTPPRPTSPFRPPWQPSGPGWEGLTDSQTYRYGRETATELAWDTQRWPLDDYEPYNQTRVQGQPFNRDGSSPLFPVSDLLAGFAITPENPGQQAEIRVEARGQVFRARIDGAGTAHLERRPAEGDGAAWETLDTAPLALRPGRATDVEFWHVDQALWLFVDGDLAAGGPEEGGYGLLPAGRLEAATGLAYSEIQRRDKGPAATILGEPGLYRGGGLSLRFVGGPFELSRVRASRDVYYRVYSGRVTFGGHPDSIADLGPDHYLLMGDNSASSLDGRLWGGEDPPVSPWVADQIDGTPGVVHRDLLIGKAFVVYLPSPYQRGPIPMFDFGRMRWVW